MRPETLKTKIHVATFDTKTADGRAAWRAFKAARLAEYEAGERPKPSFSGVSFPDDKHSFSYRESLEALSGLDIELEKEHFFDNQWNTPPIEGVSDKGLRVFDCDFSEFYAYGGHRTGVMRGHWLEQTQEMRDLRDNTLRCGYCGADHARESAPVFCDKCLDGPHLQEKDLRLLRLVPVSARAAFTYPELTPEEHAELAPRYYAAQAHGNSERGKAAAAKRLHEVKERAAKKIARAEAERDGTLWLIERGVNIENVIYYDHTGTFSFGWRTPLDAGTVSRILGIISEFPFPYELKCQDGRKLEGNKSRPDMYGGGIT